MKILICLILLVIFPVLAWASPFVVCDPYPATTIQPDNFKISTDVGATQNSTPQTVTGGVRLHSDVGNTSVGNHTMAVQACKTYPADEWHPTATEACSATVNFPFTRPAEGVAPGIPANTRLSNE